MASRYVRLLSRALVAVSNLPVEEQLNEDLCLLRAELLASMLNKKGYEPGQALFESMVGPRRDALVKSRLGGYTWAGITERGKQLYADRLKDILQLIGKYKVTNQPGTWQPIETAPKDGSIVLVFGSGYDWEGPRYCSNTIFVAAYLSDFQDGDGYWHWGAPGYIGRVEPATHWMPLPGPPKHVA